VSPLGVKGVGESGCTGSIPSVANAVMDALLTAGIGHIDMPLTPSRVWTALQSAKR
jgi:carbon-monoxide dehydrogenase large subunit